MVPGSIWWHVEMNRVEEPWSRTSYVEVEVDEMRIREKSQVIQEKKANG